MVTRSTEKFKVHRPDAAGLSAHVEILNIADGWCAHNGCMCYRAYLKCQPLFITGRKNSGKVDCTRSHSIPEIHLSQWCVELWDCHVGSNVLWRTTVLGHVESRCRWLTVQIRLTRSHPLLANIVGGSLRIRFYKLREIVYKFLEIIS